MEISMVNKGVGVIFQYHSDPFGMANRYPGITRDQR